MAGRRSPCAGSPTRSAASASSLYGYVANKEAARPAGAGPDLRGIRDPAHRQLAGQARSGKPDYGRCRPCTGGIRAWPCVSGTLGRVAVTPAMLPMGERIVSELRAAGMPDQATTFVGDLAGLYVGGSPMSST